MNIKENARLVFYVVLPSFLAILQGLTDFIIMNGVSFNELKDLITKLN